MASFENVPAHEAPRLLAEGVQVVDVREHHELRRSRLEGARHIPLGELAHRLGELERHRPVALLCRSGSRSAAAAALLARHGFERVINLAGGIVALERHLLEGHRPRVPGGGGHEERGARPAARAPRRRAWLRRAPRADTPAAQGRTEADRAAPR